MTRIEECEKLINIWKGVRTRHKKHGLNECAKDLGNRIIGLKMGLEIFKRPSIKSCKTTCNADHKYYRGIFSEIKFCKYCGEALTRSNRA